MVKQVGQPADGTETRILDAAHAVFLRRGTAGARMQEIAKEAGVNPALLHYYFRSKARLSEAVFTRAAAQLLPAAFQILGSDRPLEDKVTAIVDHEHAQLLKTPYLPAYVLSELAHHPERARQFLSAVTGRTPEEIGRSVMARLKAQIQEQVKAGRMRAIEPDQFVINLMSLCIFPFAARTMICTLLGLDAAGFEKFVARRRKELPASFLRGLRP
jgi:AcrR family transcriptional regulator